MTIFHAGRKILYIKTETTAGTYIGNAALFVGANATLPMNGLKFSPEVEVTERMVQGPSLQPIQGVHGTQKAKIAFQTALYTGGALGTAPGVLSDLFKAAFMSETIVASTSVTYASDPNSQTRLSIGWAVLKEDGTAEVEHAIFGAAGSFKIKADKVGALAVIDWEFEGGLAWETGTTLVAIDDASPQTTISYVDETANRIKFMQVTGGTGLFAAGLNIGGFEFDRGVTTELVTDITHASGFEFAKIASDKPAVSVAPVMTPISVKNHLGELVAGSVSSNAFTLGSTAGKKVTFTFPRLETTGLSDEARGVAQTWGVKAICAKAPGSAASDAFSIAFV